MNRKMMLSLIKKYYKLFLSIMIISALGCAMMSGLSSSHESLKNTLNDYVTSYNYPDLVVTTNIATTDNLDNLKTDTDIKNITYRIVTSFPITVNNKCLSVKAMSYTDEDYQKMYVWESNNSTDLNTVLVEYNFAKDNNIKLGDKITVTFNNEERTFEISKIVSLPETLSTTISDKLLSTSSDYGYIYFNRDILAQETITEKKEAIKELDSAKETLVSEKTKAINTYKNNLTLLKEKEIELTNKINELNLEKENYNELVDNQDKLNELLNTLNETNNKLNEVKENINTINNNLTLLEENKEKLTSDEINMAVELLNLAPENTSLDTIFKVTKNVENIINFLDDNNIPIDVDKSVKEVAKYLNDTINSVNDSYEYFNSEDTLTLIEMIKNDEIDIHDPKVADLKDQIKVYYEDVNDENIIDAYNYANTIVTKIYDYELENSYTQIPSYIVETGDNFSVKKVIEGINNIEDTLNTTKEFSDVTTNTELIDAYYNTLDNIDSNINLLNSTLVDINNELVSNGTSIDNLDNSINELNNSIIETTDALNKLNSVISNMKNILIEANNQINDASITLSNSKNTLENNYLNALKYFKNAYKELEDKYTEIENKKGYEDYFNQVLITFYDEDNLEDKQNKVNSLLSNVTVEDSILYENSAVKTRIDINLEPIETMSIFMPIIFFIITSIVVFLFMSLVIKKARREIGILRAIGFDKNKIRLMFNEISLGISVCAIILGLGIGYGIERYFCSYYQNFFPLPFMNISVNTLMVVISVVATILVGQLATFATSKKIEEIEPVEAISKPVDSDVNVSNLTKKALGKSDAFTKFSFLTLVRNKLRFILSVICISASVMLIFASLSFITSKNYLLDELFNKRINYDVQVFFDGEITDDMINNIKNIKSVSNLEEVGYYDTTISFNGKSYDTLINAIPNNDNLIGIYNKDNKLTLKDNGIILEKHTADYLGAKVGDKVTINNNLFEVTDISFQSINRIEYLSNSNEELLGNGYNTLIMNIDESDYDTLKETLSKDNNYLYSMFTENTYQSNLKTFKTYDIGAYLLILFAIIIGLVIVINMAYTNLLEEQRKLSMLRVLGFKQSEISRKWFLQLFMQYVLSLIIGLPMGILIAKEALIKLSTLNREYVYANGIKEYIFTIILVFIYVVISHIITMHSMKKWNINEIVKEKE